MATKPTNIAEWGTGAAPIVEPTTPQKQAGWPVDYKPPAQWFNWWMKLVHLWIVWLDAFETEAHTWTALQTFGAATFSGAAQFDASVLVNDNLTLAPGTATSNRRIDFDIAAATTSLASRTQVASTPHLLFEQQVDGSLRTVRFYIVVNAGLLITYNARYNAGSWFRDAVADCWKVTLGQGIRHHKGPAGGGAFSDAAWIQIFSTYDTYGGAIDGLQTGHVWFGTTANGQVSAGPVIPQPAWANITLSANLTPDPTYPPQWYKDSTGRVWFRGFATTNVTVASGAQVGTLPASIERYQIEPFFVTASTTQHQLVLQPPASSDRIDFESDAVSVPSGTLIPFDGISYRSV